MMTVDFAYYTDVYLGSSIPEKEFPFFSLKANAQLEKYKRDYSVTVPNEEATKNAVCAVAEAMYAITMAQSGMLSVSSASIGSVSVSYGSSRSSVNQNVDVSEKGQAREIYNAACMYLDIYRG